MNEVSNEWIEYYPRGNNPVEMPTSGFVEFIDTWDESVRHMMDMSINNIERNLMWNRAAPRCVKKFRYITEKEFLNARIKYYIKLNDKALKEIENTKNLIEKDEKRISEL